MLNGTETQVVSFFLGSEEYGIDIARVQEIIRVPALTGLPGTADYVLGIINLRGTVIPIIDLKRKYMNTAMAVSDETRIIVIEIADKKMGLMVDEVTEVVKIPDEAVVPADLISTGVAVQHLHGVARIGERLLIILNVDRI